MHDDEALSFNFWPAFADMMLALVLVLVVCIALFMAFAYQDKGVDLSEVSVRQLHTINAIADEYSVAIDHPEPNRFELRISGGREADIVFHNDLDSQRITFSEQILFDRSRSELKPEGVEAIKRVGARLKEEIAGVKEIRIEGHADKTQPKPPIRSWNLLLAARRSISVFEVLQDTVGIEPREHRMSITSFGEYMSVQRSGNDGKYSKEKLDEDNSDEDKMTRNRRIELVVVFYRS